MSLPVPNLDDRTWQQIVDEAIRLIPRYNPEWTNHNPSDPGVTLLELYAWMTEMVIYRLNKVPEKNFLTFLDLIGVRLLPPEPARTVLDFAAVDKAQGELFIKKGLQVATVQAGGAQPVTFETVKDLILTQVKLLKVASAARGQFADHTEPVLAGEGKEALFAGVKEVERFLYLGDERFSAFNEEAAIDVLLEMMPGSEGPALPSVTEWQFFDGKRWRDMAINRAESGPRHLAFSSQPGIEATDVNGIETFWIRGKLAEAIGDPRQIQLEAAQMRVEIIGDGIQPDACLVNIGQNIYLPVELGKVFYPFGEEPKYDSAIYLCTKELELATQSRVRVEVTLVDPSIVPTPEPSMDLQLVFEYYNGRKWVELGKTSAMGVSGAQGQYEFLDNTQAFSKNGSVSFKRPDDMAEVEVSGTKSWWIRGRINQGNYGTPGQYELQGENWIFKEDRPLKPPALKNMVFKYTREPQAITNVLSWNDFQFRNHSDDNVQAYVYYQPFLPDADENPAVYFGFDRAFPQSACRLYLRLDDTIDVVHGNVEDEGGKGPRTVWEFWDGARWAELLPDDGTRGFTRSGYVEFDGPKNHAQSSKFEIDAFWIRARMEAGGYDRSPVLKAVLTNAVDAVNGITLTEIAGSSDATQDQTFTLANQPILDGAKVFVRETEGVFGPERAEHLKEEGDDAIPAPAEGGTWIRWHRVEHFFESKTHSRHYQLDPIKGEISFGDGKNGRVPSMGRDNVKVEYQIGGGTTGNVGSRSLNVLKQSVAFVQGVTNPFPASGGTNAETIEEAKRRGTYAIKNRDRAVTSEDYEQLAMTASRRVSRAKCVQASDGSVRVILVPKTETEGDSRSTPSRDLIDRVSKYIDKRRLITAMVEVGKPRYVDVSLELTVSMKAGATAERVKADVRDKLKKLLHPTIGGSKGDGWPFGRAVGKADVYPAVEAVDGVDRVLELAIVDEVHHVRVETLKLGEDELPNLVATEIIERG